MLWSRPPDQKDPKSGGGQDGKKPPPPPPPQTPAAQLAAAEQIPAEGYGPDSTESSVRYAAYATRIRTILSSAHRYVAYTSDIGESFRPVARPYVVRAAYAVSWLYILGDVANEGHKAYLHNRRVLDPATIPEPRRFPVGAAAVGSPTSDGTIRAGERGSAGAEVEPRPVLPLEDYRTVMAQRAVFQSLASMGLPAFTIHTVVRYSSRALRGTPTPRLLRTWGPIGLGLAVVPFLPAMFDRPVEDAVEWVFHRGFEAYGGPDFVGSSPQVGREELLSKGAGAAVGPGVGGEKGTGGGREL